jgi:hypothetical protein
MNGENKYTIKLIDDSRLIIKADNYSFEYGFFVFTLKNNLVSCVNSNSVVYIFVE